MSKNTTSKSTSGVSVTPRPPEPEREPNVAKKITCPRCQGDGVWHTAATGVRLVTLGGAPIDPTKSCPKCKGERKIVVWIPKSQFEKEKAAKITERNAAKKKIDKEAAAAKKAIDKQ